MSQYIQIGFVDDHELFLRSICNSLNAFSERFRVEGFISGIDLLATIKDQNNFDIFIVDMAMKEINGLALIDIIRSKGITIPIILVSGIDNALSGEHPNNFGAQVLLQKTTTLEKLAAEILNLTSDTREVIQVVGNNSMSNIRLLTQRQFDVLLLASKGLSTDEIAHKLSISTNTVKHHFKAAYTALNVNNLAACISRMRELGYM